MRISETQPPRDMPLPLQQHPAFGDALARFGRPPLRFTLSGEDGARGHVQLMHMRMGVLGGIALASRGPVWLTPPREDTCDPFAAIARGLPARTLLLVNAQAGHPRPANALRLAAPRHVAEWDLRPSVRELRAGLRGKWRNRLVRAEEMSEGGLVLRRGSLPPDPGHWLFQADAAQARRRGYRALPPGFVCAFAACHPKSARLFTAHLRGRPVAAMLFLLHGPVATYQAGWSDARGRQLEAHRLILWNAACEFRQMGIVRLDLGFAERETAPGLARFKVGTGAALRRLGGSWLRLPGVGGTPP